MKCKLPVIVLLLLMACSAVLAVGLAENVLVVQNGNSPVSMRVAAYYMAQRNIPSQNLVTLSNLADSSLSSANEIITYTTYTTRIEQPIKSFMTNGGLTNKIQYIVLTKGVPHRLSQEVSGGTSGGQSVDSMLAKVNLVNPLAVKLQDSQGTNMGTVYINRYWRAVESFSHSSYGGYLVTRLDGYTEADAKALVDRALAQDSFPMHILIDLDSAKGFGDPSIQPESILTPSGTIDPNYQLTYSDYNADMTRAYQIISNRPHLSIQYDATTTFSGSLFPLTGYVSWGSNDGQYNNVVYQSLTFSPRSIAETAVSTSGRTLLPTTGGQSLIADLIAQGVAGAKGYATEPFLDAIASPSVFLDLYTSGRNLAESFYAASRFIGWKDIVLGDPLCALSGNTLTTIAAAKALPDGSLVTLNNMTVTAGTNDLGNRFYIEDSSRVSGMQVYIGKTYSGITTGSTVSVRGILTTTNGERIITGASVAY